jgi:hypothetical protein
MPEPMFRGFCPSGKRQEKGKKQANRVLQDEARLAISAKRLRRARMELERSYGHGEVRLKASQDGACAEAATFLRLACLEGVLARYAADTAACASAVAVADAKRKSLAVGDAALASLLGMGFELKLAVRAIRFCQGDLVRATDFCVQQQAGRAARAAEEKRDRKIRRKQGYLGRTEGGKWIDAQLMQQLEELGHPLLVAAEALRCGFVFVCWLNMLMGLRQIS